MIAPALAPATFTHLATGRVGWAAKPSRAPARAIPFTPPPRKTPTASSIHGITGGPPAGDRRDRRDRRGRQRHARSEPTEGLIGPSIPLLRRSDRGPVRLRVLRWSRAYAR